MSLNAQNNLGINNLALQKTFERLSTGLRINKAADDAAGLAISEKLRSQIRGLNQAIANTQDGINLIQTTEGALNETQTLLQRMRELAVQAANDTNTDSDRQKIQTEIEQLRLELTKIATVTEFNTRKLLDGSAQAAKTQVNPQTFLKQNIRVGDTLATFPDIKNFVNTIQLATTGVTTDASFQLKLVSWQNASAVDPVSLAIEVRSSVDGLLTTMRLGTGTISLVTLTVGGIVVVTVGINGANADVSVCDLGKTVLIQAIARQNPVTMVDNALTFQVGPNEGQYIKLGIDDMTSKALRLETIVLVGTTDEDSRLKAQNMLGVVDDALERVSTLRAKLGAMQNRMESTIRNLSITSENTSASESRIRDADMAKETAALTRSQILVQAGTAILAQANVNPQTALQLLQS